MKKICIFTVVQYNLFSYLRDYLKIYLVFKFILKLVRSNITADIKDTVYYKTK